MEDDPLQFVVQYSAGTPFSGCLHSNSRLRGREQHKTLFTSESTVGLILEYSLKLSLRASIRCGSGDLVSLVLYY